MLAHVHLLELRTAAMQEALERSVEYARRSGNRQQEVDAIRWLLRVRWFGPEPVEDGIRFCEQTLELARDDPSLEAVARQVLGLLEGMRGDFDRSRELMKRARDAQFDLGMVVAAAAGSSMMMGSVELMAGDPRAAEEALRWGFDMLEKIGEKGYLSTQAGYLAQAVYEQGRYEEAERLTEISQAMSAPDDLESQRLWRETKGKALARKGELPAGEALARDALAIADRTDALISRAEARLSLAEILRLSARPREAAELVREAADLYERKGIVPWVARTRALLSELEAESSSG
jgi:tetratricopeptide (TPR) repeat protein